MNRRELLKTSAALGLFATARTAHAKESASAPGQPLARPQGSIPVAFVLSDGAQVIDFCGPWEVFQDVTGRHVAAFNLYTVAESTKPLRASGGLQVVPDYDFAGAPPPKVIVIPAQAGRSPAALEWIRASSKSADVTMSVCTGAFLLARTGLLAGRAATTHHSSFKSFAADFPEVRLQRGARFVEDGNLASAGGLTSGIDLALRVVERYFGREEAARTADYMEYQGQGWLHPDSNAVYAQAVSTASRPLCPVCDMDVDQQTSPKSTWQGKTYWFCSPDHKQGFDAAPEKFIGAK